MHVAKLPNPKPTPHDCLTNSRQAAREEQQQEKRNSRGPKKTQQTHFQRINESDQDTAQILLYPTIANASTFQCLTGEKNEQMAQQTRKVTNGLSFNE